jgi:hypothetical protein
MRDLERKDRGAAQIFCLADLGAVRDYVSVAGGFCWPQSSPRCSFADKHTFRRSFPA